MASRSFLTGFLCSMVLALSYPLTGQSASGFAVVELFTSEGCSSCPPAEEMLASLSSAYRDKGLPVYALEWHVQYWDQLGWKDSFGSADATSRQYSYARALPSSVYTPEAVINGLLVPQYAGDLHEVEGIVNEVLAEPERASVRATASITGDSGRMALDIEAENAVGKLATVAALVESGLQSTPTAGENSGRLLRHSQVVRSAIVLAGVQSHLTLAVPAGLDRTHAEIIVFLQDRSTMRIVAATRTGLPAALGMTARPGKGSWSGRIVDASGVGLAGLVLQACSSRACVLGRTDSAGSFSFPALEQGSYTLKAEGYGVLSAFEIGAEGAAESVKPTDACGVSRRAPNATPTQEAD